MNAISKTVKGSGLLRENRNLKNTKPHQPGISFAERIRKQDTITLLIIGYCLLQGVITAPGCVYRLMTFIMPPLDATLEMILFVLGIAIIIGALGLFWMKLWALKMTQMTYVTLLPVLILAIKNYSGAGYFFLSMKAVDMLIAASILYYLSRKHVLEKYI